MELAPWTLVGASEQLLLPEVSFAAGIRRHASVRDLGLELAAIGPFGQQTLGDRSRTQDRPIGMKVQSNACTRTDLLHGFSEVVIPDVGHLRDTRERLPRLVPSRAPLLGDERQRRLLRRRQLPRTHCHDLMGPIVGPSSVAGRAYDPVDLPRNYRVRKYVTKAPRSSASRPRP